MGTTLNDTASYNTAVTMHKMGPNKEYLVISSMSQFSNNQTVVFVKKSDFTTKYVTLAGTGSIPVPTGDSFGNLITDTGDYGLVVLNPSGSIAWYDYANDALLTTPVSNSLLASTNNNTWYYQAVAGMTYSDVLIFPSKIIFPTYSTSTSDINHIFSLDLTASLSLTEITSSFALSLGLAFNYLNDTYFIASSTASLALIHSGDYGVVWTIPMSSFPSFSVGGDDPIYILSSDEKTLYFFYEDVNGNPFVAPIDMATGAVGTISTVPTSAAYAAGLIGVVDNESNRVLVWPGDVDMLDLTNGTITKITSPNFDTSVNSSLVDGFMDGNGNMIAFIGDSTSSPHKLYMKIFPKGLLTSTEYEVASGTSVKYSGGIMWDDTTLYLLYPSTSTQSELFEFVINKTPDNVPITVP